MGEKMECKPVSPRESMVGSGPPHLEFCHFTLKAKCECWSISLVCIAVPMFFRHRSFFVHVIVSDQEYPKGTCLALSFSFVYCGS